MVGVMTITQELVTTIAMEKDTLSTMDRPDVHAEVPRYIELTRAQLGLDTAEIQILDYGCGEGDAVRSLRQLGYQAFGCDIWLEGLDTARASLTSAGYAGDDLITAIDEAGRSGFRDGQFHFIFSEQVFEHVADLTVVARELDRLTAAGGFGLHILPPRRRVKEPHFFMPFVHWLPKNRLRHAAILGYCLLGRGGRPPQIPNAGPLKRAAFLYDYSITSTFYRPHGEIAATLREAGLDTCFVVANHRKIAEHRLLGRLVALPLIRPVSEWLLLTFAAMIVLTRKAEGPDAPPKLRFGSWVGRWARAKR
jgi:SAM-dependent methyltransferase